MTRTDLEKYDYGHYSEPREPMTDEEREAKVAEYERLTAELEEREG